MILLSHPVGNTFSRAVLDGLSQADLLDSFHTTLVFQQYHWLAKLAPPALRKELLRRSYNISDSKIFSHPTRELLRLVAPLCGLASLTEHESGWASVDQVCHHLDRAVASYVYSTARNRAGSEPPLTGVYCYEDAALATFQEAKKQGMQCYYDLPIAHWALVQRLLKEEAERLPDWEPTLSGTRDSAQKLERKAQELDLADLIVCPSRFVNDSLPEEIRRTKKVIVSEFGSPEFPARKEDASQPGKPLRLLFAGALTQRKGLADLFGALRMLGRADVELILMGTPVAPMEFYRKQLHDFTYEQPRPHRAVLELMQRCDVLVLPSIVEGRALVQQEAMICGLPIVATPNAGGEDLIEDGKTGFLIPIRSPEAIAEKIEWFLDNRSFLPDMGRQARLKALAITWESYQRKILIALTQTD